MPRLLVSIVDLEAELEEWHRRLARAAEEWVHERAAGRSTEAAAERMRVAEHNTRRLERRIRRRTKGERRV